MHSVNGLYWSNLLHTVKHANPSFPTFLKFYSALEMFPCSRYEIRRGRGVLEVNTRSNGGLIMLICYFMGRFDTSGPSLLLETSSQPRHNCGSHKDYLDIYKDNPIKDICTAMIDIWSRGRGGRGGVEPPCPQLQCPQWRVWEQIGRGHLRHSSAAADRKKRVYWLIGAMVTWTLICPPLLTEADQWWFLDMFG